MAEYQNIFTRVQVRGPAHEGPPLKGASWGRIGQPLFVHLFGRFGDAQLGPIYLGATGMASLIFGFFAIEIIGFNMLASVHWNPVEFVRQLPWAALAAAERWRLVAAGRVFPHHLDFAVVAADVQAGAGAWLGLA